MQLLAYVEGVLTSDIADAKRRVLDHTSRLKSHDELDNHDEGRLRLMQSLVRRIHAIDRECAELLSALTDERGQVARSNVMLITGEAGIGKSHYLAKVVEGCVNQHLPAILLLGEHFRREPILAQIRHRLGITDSNDEFLGALSTVARAMRRRAVIVIDALNEADDKRLWKSELPALLAAIGRFPEVCLVLSIRSPYAEYCLPDLSAFRLLRIQHPGFSTNQEEATVRYFTHFGVSPSSPALQPEFSNPLFLKLYCEVATSNLLMSTDEQSALTTLLSVYTKAVNKRLAEDVFSSDANERIVQRAVDGLANAMISEGRSTVDRPQAKAIVDAIYSGADFPSSLYRHLLHEGILAETVYYDDQGDQVDCVRFGFERIGDYWRADAIIRKVNSHDSASQPQALADVVLQLLGDGESPYSDYSLVESLLILIGERQQIELPGLIAKADQSPSLMRAALGSIPWRSTCSITSETESFVEECLSVDELRFEALDCLVRVATRVDHRLNARWLHYYLASQTMADRDSTWSIYLHSRWIHDDVLSRIVEWTSKSSDRPSTSAQVQELCGITLTWFLTSSNRFLRDRATKGLVALFDDEPVGLAKLVAEFSEVDDLYVTERLLAATCGVVLRSSDAAAVSDAADVIFNRIFAAGTPTPHLMIREYARLIIERTQYLLDEPRFNLQVVRPPFKSEAQLTAAPWKGIRESHDEPAFSRLVLSLWPEHGDFARYVLGSGYGGAHAWASDRNRLDTAIAKKARPQSVNVESVLEAMMRSIPATEKDATLEASDVQGQQAEQVTEEVHDPEAQCYLESDLPCRWIFERVIDLGWTPERFGDFDQHFDSHGRDAHKPERIGKKYQWIAYHEWLAHVTDQRPYRSGVDSIFQYDGAWEIGVRDIDPTCRVRRTHNQPSVGEIQPRPWWAGVDYSEWAPQLSHLEWLKVDSDLPNLSNLLRVTDPVERRQYVSLCSYVRWELPRVASALSEDKPMRRRMWFTLQSYLLHAKDRDTYVEWAANQDFWGRWMPEDQITHDLFLHELYWAPAYLHLNRDERNDVEIKRHVVHDVHIPCPVVVTTTEYGNGAMGFDCSVDESITMCLPGIHLAEEMRLRPGSKDGMFVDQNKVVVAFDPSVTESGPSTLLFDENALLRFLEERQYSLVWTLIGGKEVHPVKTTELGTSLGVLRLSGVYTLDRGNTPGRLNSRFITSHTDEGKSPDRAWIV